jgi:hypothetical protein
MPAAPGVERVPQMDERLGLNLHRDGWSTARSIAAYRGLNFADAAGPARARIRERAQLEERSLRGLLQRAHTLGLAIATLAVRDLDAPGTDRSSAKRYAARRSARSLP